MTEKIAKLLSQLSLEEKASLCSGQDAWTTKAVERLGIPPILMTDGPHGLRKQEITSGEAGLNESVPATCFPSGVGLAATWNRELVYELGVALGREANSHGIAIVLGPAVNIKRSPLCGRNFEYFSEDPYLAGEMAQEHVNGIQSQGLGASVKHFAANNQETNRMSVDTLVDERTLREIYLPAFEKAVVGAQPWTVMCAYNKLNGKFCSENEWLLRRILKEEWGHAGLVVSDWGACNERVAGLIAGQELEMPGSNGINDAKIVAAVRNGTLDPAFLDAAVGRILELIFAYTERVDRETGFDPEHHHRLARRIASESMVLLKNEGEVLPLRPKGKIAFIGAFADKPRYQGAGSSHINPTRLDSVLEEARRLLAPEGEILFAPGYRLESDAPDEELHAAALKLARECEQLVLFIGLSDRFESEGFDRTHLGIPESHRALVEELAKVNSHLVVVLSNGSPVEMPWAQSVPAILESYLGGQAWGGAVADLLFGVVNPSGKLAETFPARMEDSPAYLNFPGDDEAVEYREGIFVGYRHYEAKKIAPLFPFGHGLSYTRFAYGNLAPGSSRIRENEALNLSVEVTNTGARSGQEVVQLYVRDVQSTVLRPIKELKGFQKVQLEPGQSATVRFVLDRRSFAFWHPRLGGWRVESGEFEILVGSSSADIRARAIVHVDAGAWKDRIFDRNTRVGHLLDHPLLGDFAGKVMRRIRAQMGSYEEGSPEALMMDALCRELPLRVVVSFSGGRALSDGTLDQMVEILNGVIGPDEAKKVIGTWS